MFADITKPPRMLPQPVLKNIEHGISLLYPLSRRGQGPGLIILTGDSEDPLQCANGIPSPLMKWAEEGYTVVEIQDQALTNEQNSLQIAVAALRETTACQPKNKIGLIGKYYCSSIHFAIYKTRLRDHIQLIVQRFGARWPVLSLLLMRLWV
jgi:carboxymethylenebutenolidase